MHRQPAPSEVLAPPATKRFILPLLRRHIDDAAFYWMQIDGGLAGARLSASRVQHFTELLEANLEGLGVDSARPWAADLTQQSLTRWRKPGEAFTAMYAALCLPCGGDARSQALEAVLHVVRQVPDLLLRGTISALAWAPSTQAEPWLTVALTSSNPVDRVAALRACALRHVALAQWSEQAQHSSPHVRAAACRAAGSEHLAALDTLANDPDFVVRAESVLAWVRFVPLSQRNADAASQAASRLWQCVSTQLELLNAATGWYRMQARRRLDRWLRHLAWLAPLGHPGVPQLLTQLPPRLALNFILHHGDAALLPIVLHAMRDDEHSRWAGWVWQCLTGVNLQDSGLIRPDPALDLDAPLSQAQQDADHGLPLPDANAVAAHPGSQIRLAPGERLLQGQPLHAHHLRDLLDPAANQPQALRCLAAHALAQLHPGYVLNLRASPDAQAAVLARMGVSV